MSSIDYNISIPTFLTTNKFEECENSFNFGLNSFGCESIIKYNDDIWKFNSFETGTSNAIYYNKDNVKFIVNLYNMPPNIIRMRVCK